MTATLPSEPECRRSWMQDGDAPTCPAWITARDIYRAERRKLGADNALRALLSDRDASRWGMAHPDEYNRRLVELDRQQIAARDAIQFLLRRNSRCDCTGPDMPR